MNSKKPKIVDGETQGLDLGNGLLRQVSSGGKTERLSGTPKSNNRIINQCSCCGKPISIFNNFCNNKCKENWNDWFS